MSRSGKPLYNLDHLDKEKYRDCEIYETDWETSMGHVRRSVNGSPVDLRHVYSLWPLDERLYICNLVNPSVEIINELMQKEVDKGYEGLILRQGDNKFFKVKPKDTVDVYVTGFQKGTGKHENKMGALLTDYGKVGTGFTDAQREYWQDLYDLDEHLGLLIEVEFMEWTKNAIMRHPRYLRIRDDKEEESLGEAYASMFQV